VTPINAASEHHLYATYGCVNEKFSRPSPIAGSLSRCGTPSVGSRNDADRLGHLANGLGPEQGQSDLLPAVIQTAGRGCARGRRGLWLSSHVPARGLAASTNRALTLVCIRHRLTQILHPLSLRSNRLPASQPFASQPSPGGTHHDQSQRQRH
jgi:hypothetical protein